MMLKPWTPMAKEGLRKVEGSRTSCLMLDYTLWGELLMLGIRPITVGD
jgi:hypothetical protein